MKSNASGKYIDDKGRTTTADFTDSKYQPYFVSSLHSHPLRDRPVLFLLPAKFPFNNERFVSSLQQHNDVHKL